MGSTLGLRLALLTLAAAACVSAPPARPRRVEPQPGATAREARAEDANTRARAEAMREQVRRERAAAAAERTRAALRQRLMGTSIDQLWWWNAAARGVPQAYAEQETFDRARAMPVESHEGGMVLCRAAVSDGRDVPAAAGALSVVSPLDVLGGLRSPLQWSSAPRYNVSLALSIAAGADAAPIWLASTTGASGAWQVFASLGGARVEPGDTIDVRVSVRTSAQDFERFDATMRFEGSFPVGRQLGRARVECRWLPAEALASERRDLVRRAVAALERAERGRRRHSTNPAELAVELYPAQLAIESVVGWCGVDAEEVRALLTRIAALRPRE